MKFHSIDHSSLPSCVELFLRVFNSAPWDENWTMEAVTERLGNCLKTPDFRGLSVSVNGAPAGFIMGNLERWDTGRHFNIREMCVEAEHRGSGLGTALITRLEESLKAEGAERMYLLTARETPAQAFYGARGFYVSPKMILMAKRL